MNIEKRFFDTFSIGPDLIAAAPGRVNIIGEHIDYSQGYVLPFAIQDRTYAAVRKRDDNLVRIASLQRKSVVHTYNLEEIRPPMKRGWENYALGVIWALGIDQYITHGVDILIDGQVPLGAGLSSSAALECSVGLGLNTLFDLDHSLEALARIAQSAENDFVGMPCGIMDQSVSLMAKAGFALLLDCRDLTTSHIPFDLAANGLELLVVDTRAHHALVDGGYAARRADCESVARKLGVDSLRDLSMEQIVTQKEKLTEIELIRARHGITEMARVLDSVTALKESNFEQLGRLINLSHASLKDDYAVSCPELDLVVETAQAAGALGARMVGGGFGGSAIALVRAGLAELTSIAIREAFAKSGLKAPRFFPSLPSQGAQII